VKAVVDTNVVAYYLLKTEPFVAEARAFWATVDHPMAPAFWAAEFTNVVWSVARSGGLAPVEALERLRLASMLGIESIDVTSLWSSALSCALDADHPAYDTLFVALARRASAPLVTFDKALLKKFPDVATRPAALATPAR
jgi:predicted nucleic acid-binding protein